MRQRIRTTRRSLLSRPYPARTDAQDDGVLPIGRPHEAQALEVIREGELLALGWEWIPMEIRISGAIPRATTSHR